MSLKQFAKDIRVATLEVFEARGFGHVGGAMSVVETLAALYGGAMQYDPKNPGAEGRDRLVLSKGHAGPALYATLALKGFFPMEWLKTLNQPGTKLPSHCDRNMTPGVDMTTGSLGQGISLAIGLALGAKLKSDASTTYLIIGDGECNEGQIWEGALYAGGNKLDNMIVLVDENGQQLDGYTENVLPLGSLSQKFAAFDFSVQEVDGHDPDAVLAAIQKAKAVKGQPSAIILKTKKGYGCTFAVDQEFNHHIAFTQEQMDAALTAAKEVAV
jgi:transketolase